jgi:iron complex outermembrane receptor protein
VNRSYQLSPEIRFTPSAATTVTAGFDLVHGWMTGTETREANRWQNSLFLSASQTVALPWETPFEVIFFPSLRYDRFSDVASDVSPRVGMNVGLFRSPDLRLRASYGKSFRVPTFNELFWIAGGNPDLSPERSLSADAGLLAGIPLLGTVTAEFTVFTVETTNRIIWLPATGSYWSPRNIGRVRSDGIEAELRWTTLDGALSLAGNSTWTTVTKRSADVPGDPTEGKRLIYTPSQTVHISATVVAGDAELYLRHSWTSYRYTTEMNDRFLPSFGVTSATVRWGFAAGDFHITLKGEVENLFNTSYQTMALFPMPLREFRGTVGVDL